MATTPAKTTPAKTPAAKTTRAARAKPTPAKTAAAKPARRAPRRKPAPKGNRALSAGAALLAIGAGIAGFLARRQIAAWALPGSVEHDAPDLALDKPRPGTAGRAPVDFRPDIDAPMSAADREALRPATGPAPSLVGEAGTMNAQTGASN